MNAQSDRELMQLLPWFANGTLSAAERAAVEELLARSPEAAQELRLWTAVQGDVRQEPAEAGVDMAWRRMERSLRLNETRGEPARYWKVAAAVAAVTIVGFQSLILWRMEKPEIVQLGETPAVVSANEWLVQVRFVDAAAVVQVSELLAGIDARIVDGPSALGLYRIAVARGGRFEDTAALLAWLNEQPIVAESALPPQQPGDAP